MEILVVVGIVAGLLVGAGAGYLVHQKLAGARTAADTLEAERLLADARRDADSVRREADIEARQRMLEMRQEAEAALEERRTELAKIEERTLGREEGIEQKVQELNRREQGIDDRETHARTVQDELKVIKEQQVRDLERVAGMTTQQARDQLLRETEEQVRHDMAKLVRQRRGRGQAGVRPPRPQHHRDRHPAHRREPRRARRPCPWSTCPPTS